MLIHGGFTHLAGVVFDGHEVFLPAAAGQQCCARQRLLEVHEVFIQVSASKYLMIIACAGKNQRPASVKLR